MSTFPQILNSESLAGAGENRSHYAQQKDSISNSLTADDGISNHQNSWIWFLVVRLRAARQSAQLRPLSFLGLTSSFTGPDSRGFRQTTLLGVQR